MPASARKSHGHVFPLSSVISTPLSLRCKLKLRFASVSDCFAARLYQLTWDVLYVDFLWEFSTSRTLLVAFQHRQLANINLLHFYRRRMASRDRPREALWFPRFTNTDFAESELCSSREEYRPPHPPDPGRLTLILHCFHHSYLRCRSSGSPGPGKNQWQRLQVL